jgi:peroxiredoxin
MMKKIISHLFILTFAFSGCNNSPDQKKSDPVNQSTRKVTKSVPRNGALAAPDFTLADLNGNQVSLNDYKGKVVLLNFWGTWCGPCRREIPDFVKLTNKYKKDGLEIVGITLTSGSAENIQKFADKWKINYTLLTDIEGNETQSVTAHYGRVTGKQINGIPTTFIIDRDGYIRQRYVGPRSEEIFYRDLEAYL